jgi:hypothetical protein
MSGSDGIRRPGPGRRRGSWPASALLALGAWLVVSPLVWSTTRVTAGLVSAVTSGLALVVLAGWALLAGWAVLAGRRRQGRSTPSAGGGYRRQVDAGDRQR